MWVRCGGAFDVAVCSAARREGCHSRSGRNACDYRPSLWRLGAVAASRALLRRARGHGEPDHPRWRQGNPPQRFIQSRLYGPYRRRGAGYRDRHVPERTQRDRGLDGCDSGHRCDQIFGHAVGQRDGRGRRTTDFEFASERELPRPAGTRESRESGTGAK